MNLRGFLKNRIVKNAGWLIGGRIVHMILAFFVGLLTARYLGPGNYGLINYAASFTSFFASVCTLGINSIIIKDFVDHPDEEGTAVGTAIILRLISSFLSFLMVAGIVLVVDRNEPVTVLVVILCGLGMIFQVFDTINYWFQAKLQSKFTSIATTVAYIVVSAYKIFLLATEKSVAWFAVSTSIDYVVIAVFLLWIYKRQNGPKMTFSWKKAKQLLSSGQHFILAGLMVSIYGGVDKFMLKHMLDEAAVGYYATALAVCNMWVFVLSAIIDSMYPAILQAYQDDQKDFAVKNRRLYAMVFYVSTVVSVVFVVFGDLIIRILYGKDYAPAAAPLKIITWYTAFSYLGVARNAWMVCHNCQKYLKYLYIGAAVLNVILNAVLIPLWGETGAAAASLITQVSTIFVFPVLIRELRPNVKLMLEGILFQKIK